MDGCFALMLSEALARADERLYDKAIVLRDEIDRTPWWRVRTRARLRQEYEIAIGAARICRTMVVESH